MKKLKLSGILLLSAFLLNTATAQAKDYAYDFDYGALLGLGFNKNITDRFEALVHTELWLNDNFTGYERIMPSATLTYTVIPKYLKAFVYYAYFHQSNKVHQHRYQVGLTGSYAAPHMTFSLSSRFEQTHKNGIPNNKWRNQLKAVGRISPSCHWNPFASIELFEAMNSMNKTKLTGIERIRYEAGTTYSPCKLITLEMKLRAERLVAKKQLYSSVGLGLKFNL